MTGAYDISKGCYMGVWIGGKSCEPPFGVDARLLVCGIGTGLLGQIIIHQHKQSVGNEALLRLLERCLA